MHHNRLNHVEPDIEVFVSEGSWADLGETIRRLAGKLVDEIATDPSSLTIALLLVGSSHIALDDDHADDDGPHDFPLDASWN